MKGERGERVFKVWHGISVDSGKSGAWAYTFYDGSCFIVFHYYKELQLESRQVGATTTDAFDSVMKASPAEAKFDVWVSSRDELQARLYPTFTVQGVGDLPSAKPREAKRGFITRRPSKNRPKDSLREVKRSQERLTKKFQKLPTREAKLIYHP